MEALKKDWITEGLIDFEYKKYLMLAYMQHVDGFFSKSMLYPALADLVEHYNQMNALRGMQSALSDKFPKTITGISEKKNSWTFESTFVEPDELKSIAEIVDFALPHFENKISDGKNIYEFVEASLSLDPVGVLPLYKDEGYVLLHDDHDGDVLIYRYRSSLIEGPNEQYRGLKTDFLRRERMSLGRTFETIKVSLTRQFADLPNPATWLISSALKFPLVETFLPVTKRLLMRQLHTGL
mgnify:CR=1 FL=1|jgi:hypothetical protein